MRSEFLLTSEIRAIMVIEEKVKRMKIESNFG